MTNRKQDAVVMVLRGGSILQHLLMPLIHSEQVTFVKDRSPGVATRARGKVNRREMGWDWGRIVKTFDLLSEGSSGFRSYSMCPPLLVNLPRMNS